VSLLGNYGYCLLGKTKLLIQWRILHLAYSSVNLTHTSPGYSGLLILMVAHHPPCNNFFQHTPAVRQCCCIVWLDSKLMWAAVADCCVFLKLKLSPIMVAVKRLHRCRPVVWHGHSANQINHQSLSSTLLLGSQYSMTLLANHHRCRCWLY
jgi:hypothetical protein